MISRRLTESVLPLGQRPVASQAMPFSDLTTVQATP